VQAPLSRRDLLWPPSHGIDISLPRPEAHSFRAGRHALLIKHFAKSFPMHALCTSRVITAYLGMTIYGASSGFAATGAATAFPSAWPDQAPSIYSQPLCEDAKARAITAEKPMDAEEMKRTSTATPAPLESPVVPVSFADPDSARPIDPPANEIHRRLAPRRRDAKKPSTDFPTDSLPSFGLNFDSFYTTGAALAVVLGIFFLCAALVRRGAKKSNARLPEEAVSVLGRVPLAARQFAELIRVGNKLVLVSVTPHGAEPLTEITDPAEIDRLVGLCRQGQKGSSTAEFDQIFRKLADESAPSGFLGNEVPQISSRLAAPADVFAAYRGARSA